MADIFHQFPIKARVTKVFRAVSTPAGLDKWWTKASAAEPGLGAVYDLSFGSECNWQAVASQYIPYTNFELELTDADADWQGTRLSFILDEQDGVVNVTFRHTGWPEDNEHYRISCYCWAMYLRLLKRFVEFGEIVRYEDRLDV